MEEFVADLIGIDVQTVNKAAKILLAMYGVALAFNNPRIGLPFLAAYLVVNSLLYGI